MLEGFGAGREVSAPTQQLDGLGLTDIVLCAPGFESDDDGQEFSSHRSDLQSRCPVLLPKSPASTATCWRVSPTKRTSTPCSFAILNSSWPARLDNRPHSPTVITASFRLEEAIFPSTPMAPVPLAF